MRENAAVKARRYLTEGRVIITAVSDSHVAASVRGDGAIYSATYVYLSGAIRRLLSPESTSTRHSPGGIVTPWSCGRCDRSGEVPGDDVGVIFHNCELTSTRELASRARPTPDPFFLCSTSSQELAPEFSFRCVRLADFGGRS